MEDLIGTAADDADVIKDSTTESFEADVIQASNEVPVVVDFWAPWCQPCKTLGPTIEKVVREARGKVRLVKVNIDENQQIAQALRVQSIPAVFGFVKGQPVDGFVGAQPESQIKAFVDRLAGQAGPTPVDEAIEQAKAALADDDHNGAAALFGQVLQHEPDNIAAIAGMARCLLALGDAQAAAEVLARAGDEHDDDPEISGARAAVALATQAAAASGEIGGLEARIAANPKDFEARLELAMALFGSGERETAVDHLLEILSHDLNWNDDAARKQLLEFFEAMGPTDPLTLSARRRLSSLLFS
jgi:putative thioredoxin